MKKWCFLLAALLLLPLSACGSSETLDRFYGRVEEVLAGESFRTLVPLGTELTVDLRPDVEGNPLAPSGGSGTFPS